MSPKSIWVVLISLLVVILVVVLSVGFCYVTCDVTRNAKKRERGREIIFTCTTWFDSSAGGKWDDFVYGVNTLLDNHPGIETRICKWLVINEPRTESSLDWESLLRERFPWIQLIQKTEKQRGQAKSLNIILDEIAPYYYWLHWEEAWFVTRPFLDAALAILANNPVTQLQLTKASAEHEADWHSLRVQGQDERGWALVPTNPENFQKFRKKRFRSMDEWPVYSLRPSLNVVSFYKSLPKFSPDPKLWPVIFEWDYGLNWVLAGGVKAIFIDSPATRRPTHRSTYHAL